MSNERDLRSDEAELSPPSADILKRFRTVVASVPTPFANAEGDSTPDPVAGQFWRARWEGLSTAVLLLSAPRTRTVSLAIVTFDPDLADDHAKVLRDDSTDLDTPAVIWVDDARQAPLAVLDTYLGELHLTPGSGKTAALVEALGRLGTEGSPIARPSDPRAIYRALLLDDIEQLVQASWLTAPVGSSGRERVSDRPSELAEKLGISIPEALALKRGTRAASEQQIEAMSELLAADTSNALAHSAQLPDMVVDLFDHPRYRQQVAKLARLRGQDERFVREWAAFTVFGAPARATADEMTDDALREIWRQRVEQFFDIQFEDLGEDE